VPLNLVIQVKALQVKLAVDHITDNIGDGGCGEDTITGHTEDGGG
jgi:hypothetical protein